MARQQGVTLEIGAAPGDARVQGDRDQLEQVFTNLIDNAMKYGGEGAKVRVRPAAPSRAHPSRRRGDGRGRRPRHPARAYPPADRALLPGQRGVEPQQGRHRAGLAIVKHILNRHGGRLEIASTPGGGSAFTVWLPRSEGAGSPAAAAENLRSA